MALSRENFLDRPALAVLQRDRLRALFAEILPRNEFYTRKLCQAGVDPDEVGATGDLSVVERRPGNGMTDYFGVSGMPAQPELEQMSEAGCERRIALLRAAWTTFDDVASRVSASIVDGT